MTAPRPEERITKLIEWVVAVAGPLTALTGVLYYFGWTRTNAVFRYFGVDPAILEFDLADYVVRAAGPAFAPAVAMTVGAAALVALNRAAFWLELYCLRHPVTVRGRTLVVRAPSIVLIYVGVVALWCSMRVAFGLPDYLGIGAAAGLTEPIPAALALAGGALVAAIGLRLVFVRLEPAPPRAPTVPMSLRFLLFAAVLIATFWATSVYSQRAGEAVAAFINQNPTSQPEVTVYSEDSLRLWSAVSSPPEPETERFRHTYTGLRLLIYANERWLLLTGERNSDGRLAVAILRDDDHIRVNLGQ